MSSSHPNDRVLRARTRRVRAMGLFALAASALAVAVAWTALGVRRPPGGAVQVEVRPVPLDPGDPARTRVGELVYRGGLWLLSRDTRFGGLSDLRVSGDGRTVYAVSDCGRGFIATLSYHADGHLAGLSDAQMVDLTGPDGHVLGAADIDSESLVREDSFLDVGFEGRPRVLRYRLDPPFAGPARPVPIPAGVSACGENEGLETMTALGGGRRLLVCEGRRAPSETVPAWIGTDGHWVERSYPLLFEGGWAGEPFRPTSATLLPGGDVLVVERRYPPMAVRIVRLTRANLEGEGPLEPHQIARLEPPLTLDNFEGIDVRQDGAGKTLVYLVSDDNNCGKPAVYGPGRQRTLLLMFALAG
jgi:hypothetical protein